MQQESIVWNTETPRVAQLVTDCWCYPEFIGECETCFVINLIMFSNSGNVCDHNSYGFEMVDLEIYVSRHVYLQKIWVKV